MRLSPATQHACCPRARPGPSLSLTRVVSCVALLRARSTKEHRLRWECLLLGWLPALLTISTTVQAIEALPEAKHQAAEAVAAAAKSAEAAAAHTANGRPGGRDHSERRKSVAPPGLLSLRALCLLHAGLETLAVWGLAPRLSTASPAPTASSGPANVRGSTGDHGTASGGSGGAELDLHLWPFGVLLDPRKRAPLSESVKAYFQSTPRLLRLLASICAMPPTTK